CFNISILTKIEFLGWDKHTPEGFIEPANIYPLDEEIANKAIELRTKRKIKLADAVIAATALLNNLIVATRNVDDFKGVKGLQITNPFGEEDREEASF
ncbi:MAG: type II toxin-antitoxin system VapC family toxin, partial [Desulfobacterales bacterium]|nr:type II toxin-antitoxin system VapC family toxin [Desulfobacterales bacterium]